MLAKVHISAERHRISTACYGFSTCEICFCIPLKREAILLQLRDVFTLKLRRQVELCSEPRGIVSSMTNGDAGAISAHEHSPWPGWPDQKINELVSFCSATAFKCPELRDSSRYVTCAVICSVGHQIGFQPFVSRVDAGIDSKAIKRQN